jgi:hypothetical protein
LRVECHAIQRHQRFCPIERFGDAGRLEQIHRPQSLRERDDLARKRFCRLRTFTANDRELAPRIGIIDPMI